MLDTIMQFQKAAHVDHHQAATKQAAALQADIRKLQQQLDKARTPEQAERIIKAMERKARDLAKIKE